MNINKRKKMYRMGLLSDKPVQQPVVVQKVEPVVVVEQPVQLPVALKELPEQEVIITEEVKEEVPVVEKKKSTKVKKLVEEDKPSDV